MHSFTRTNPCLLYTSYLGIVPRNSDRHAMATLTLKQNYYPWNIHIADKLSFEPLACGVYINTLLDRDFWGKQPDKYPQGYYLSLIHIFPVHAAV